jgi:glutathione S-transferase
MADTQITLYTFHGCPYAHRIHIALNELGLQHQEVQIDLDHPREPWYLQINPVSLYDVPLTSLFRSKLIQLVQRGLVPALQVTSPQLGGGKPQILTESGIIAEFLADISPNSHLLPPSNTPNGALFRARVAFFVDTWNTKIGTKSEVRVHVE